MPDYRPLRPAASSPGPAHQPPKLSQGPDDVSIRSMRRKCFCPSFHALVIILKCKVSIVKVLYSFDNENKTNCLARWPHPLDIRTAYLEENTQIGVIELKTCIQAIVAASPELVAKLGQDYTVYAYDYSEYETPLVGQGMLSWVLASSSSTPSAPAHQPRTIVTGRVCKNLLGLFSSNSHETLEVKLRLVPVPTSLQSEYIESMKKYRDISQMMPEGFDPQAWTSFVQANPAILQLASKSRSQSPAIGPGQSGTYGIEHVQRLMTGNGYPPKSTEGHRLLPQNSANPALRAGSQLSRMPSPATSVQRNAEGQHFIAQSDHPTSDAAAQHPRIPSPASSVQSTTGPRKRGRPPGTNAKPRNRAPPKKPTERQTSVDTGYASNTERFEEGPNKKRARVFQAEWSGSTDFGKQPGSLRVAASTAASVRIHQPTAVRPTNSLASSLERPPREPTPVADSSNQIQRPHLPVSKSSLRRESFVMEKRTYASPYHPRGDDLKPGGSAMTSPEASQADSSPVDIASSPPFYRAGSTAPSSPSLPRLPRHFNDSGFMSGSIDDLFENDEMRPIDDEDLDVAAHYDKRPNLRVASIQEKIPGNIETNKDNEEKPRTYETQQSQQQDKQFATSVAKPRRGGRCVIGPGLSRTASSGNLLPPPTPASDPVRPSTMNRSQTWSGHAAAHPASDVTPLPQATEPMERPVSRARKGSETGNGSGVKRKKAIQSKLALSVAAGEMPPFCEHCGAIETPTWRKAWVKIHSGTPEHVVISEEEGGIIAWQTLQTDATGTICLYRIVKKSVLKTDEGFTEILLCNREFTSLLVRKETDQSLACGIWLHTRKCMRPKAVWDKSQNDPGEKRKRSSNCKNSRADSISNQTAEDASNGTALHSQTSSPANDGAQTDATEAEPQLPVMKHRRSSSVQITSLQRRESIIDDASAVAALQTANQSSPHKFKGSMHVPIEVEDLTPQPTRRVLFPSPIRSEAAVSKRSSTGEHASFERHQSSANATGNGTHDQADKENYPPPEDNNALDDLSAEGSHQFNHFTTPTPASSSRSQAFKTPKRSPNHLPSTSGDFFSSAAKALLRQPTTPKQTPTRGSQPLGELTPFTAHLNQLLSDANNGSPGSNNFEFPSLPSLHNTPGRRTVGFDFSNFDSQDFLSTDVPMPSSPPVWFGVYEDPIEHGPGSLWGDYHLPNSASAPDEEDDADISEGPKTSGLVVDENGRASIEFQAIG